MPHSGHDLKQTVKLPTSHQHSRTDQWSQAIRAPPLAADRQSDRARKFAPPRAVRNHLVLHMPPNSTLQSFPLNEWVSQLEIKILADDYSRQFPGEYIKGDLFIDRPPGTAENFMRLLYAKRLTVEFGTRNDRLNLAVEANFGPAAIDAAMRHPLPSSTGEKPSKITFLSTDDLVNTCLNFKRTGTVKPNIGGKYWLIWGSTSCPQCDSSKGATSTTITIGNKKSKRITSEAQCKSMLTNFASSLSEHKLEADLHCIRVDDRDLE